MKHFMNRVILFTLFLPLVIVFPWWLAALLVIFGFVFLPLYIEGIIFAYMLDVLHVGYAGDFLHAVPFTLVSILILMATFKVKRQIMV